MSDIAEVAHQVRLKLGRQVAEILDAALACTPAGGTSSQWREMTAGLGATPMEASAGAKAAEDAGQVRGAPVDEVRQCLDLLVARVRRESGLAAEALESLLSGLAERHAAQYAVLVTVPEETVTAPAPSGGMFAFAVAVAKNKADAPQHQGGSYLLHCGECGAPRLRSSDLVCEYCGARTTQ